MTNDFLFRLNGENKGKFKSFLDQYHGSPRVCWYPSCGYDFRAPMFLSKAYRNSCDGLDDQLPQGPDLYLYTDYKLWGDESVFQIGDIFYQDKKTRVTCKSVERLPDLDLDWSKARYFVSFPEFESYTHQVYFLQIEIESKILGNIQANVLYCFAVNELFYKYKMAPYTAKISHIIKIRYGSGFGGSRGSGSWVQNIFDKVGGELLITDRQYLQNSGDNMFFRLNPAYDEGDYPEFKSIHIVPSEKWSFHGDVHWQIKVGA